MVDATAAVGPGDRTVLERSVRQVAGSGAAQGGGSAGPALVVVVNKIDRAPSGRLLERLAEAEAAVDALAEGLEVEYFPVSARTGQGVAELTEYLVGRLDEGPPFFPDDVVTDTPEALWVAELVREQLLAKTRDELPHAITCRVTEWEWPHIRVEIIVERDSQKAIVIGARRRGPQGGRARPCARTSPKAPTSTCTSRSSAAGRIAPRCSTASGTDLCPLRT